MYSSASAISSLGRKENTTTLIQLNDESLRIFVIRKGVMHTVAGSRRQVLRSLRSIRSDVTESSLMEHSSP
ncbi:hypothetical protein BA6E_124327 [Bacteroidales bacterium 6E]|nr:hypothetical protein BA6E_124327 [Bacteroidales bacterium 6E]